jgi:hypothetical protein
MEQSTPAKLNVLIETMGRKSSVTEVSGRCLSSPKPSPILSSLSCIDQHAMMHNLTSIPLALLCPLWRLSLFLQFSKTYPSSFSLCVNFSMQSPLAAPVYNDLSAEIKGLLGSAVQTQTDLPDGGYE